MHFNLTREDFSERELMMINKGKNPLSHSSSSSSSSRKNSISLASMSSLPSLIKKDGIKLDLMEEVSQESDDNNSNAMQKLHMFDKVVTPSDVGKLNRLVIPKQHAERYFPLDSSSNKNGLLLNFEDRDGKQWRFRYSYWNSSQSYVITKGWSKFVKDKKLDAGDMVSFYRGVGGDRLYIDWRRRLIAPSLLPNFYIPQDYHIHRSVPWSPWPFRPPGAIAAGASRATVLPNSQFHLLNGASSYPYNMIDFSGADSSYYSHGNHVNYMNYSPALRMRRGGEVVVPTVLESVPVVCKKAASAKKMRLFGVNMECPEEDECKKVLSSTTTMQFPIVDLQPSRFSSSSSSSLQLSLYNDTTMQANLYGKREDIL